MTTVVLLTISNIFMTIAWYGHLRYKEAPLGRVVLDSRGVHEYAVWLAGGPRRVVNL